MVNRVELFRASTWDAKKRNVAHIVRERHGTRVRTLCGLRYEESVGIPTDYKTRMCPRCSRYKDKQDIGA